MADRLKDRKAVITGGSDGIGLAIASAFAAEGAHLWLVMPNNPSVDGNGTIGAFLRVRDAHGNVLAETTTDTFNIYQNTASLAGNRTYAWNGFSLSFGGLGAELFGTTIWSKTFLNQGGLGTFRCSVNGYCALGGITEGQEPCIGSISGGAPKGG